MSELIRPGLKGRYWDLPQDGRPYLVCRVTSGADWWDLDDEVAAVPGRQHVHAPHLAKWHAVPLTRLAELEVIAERNPGRLVVHRAANRR
jgi:hypothetical protein